MSAKNFTTSFTFPPAFSIERLNFAIATLEKAFAPSFLNLADMIATLDQQDHSIMIEKRLLELQNMVSKFKFETSYLVDSSYVITSHDELKQLRQNVVNKCYQFQTALLDIDVILRQQAFSLNYDRTAEIDAQVSTINAFNEESESSFVIRSRLAIDNLRAIERFYASIDGSTLMTTVWEARELVYQIEPVVSLGSKTSVDVMDKFEWKARAEF